MDLFGIKLWPERSVEDEEFPEQRRHRWLLIWALVGLVVGGILLWPVMQPAYRHFRAQQLAARAQQQIAAADASGARASLDRALHYEPSRADFLMALGDALRAEGSPRYATMLIRAAAIETNRPELATAAVAACVTNGAADLVVPLLDRFMPVHGNHAPFLYWTGRVLATEGRHAEAEAVWLKAAQRAPQDARIQLDVGVQEIGSRKPEVVSRGIQRLEVLQTHQDAAIRFEAAAALANNVAASDPQKASAIWQRYLSSNPADRKAALAQLTVLTKVDPDAASRQVASLWGSASNIDQKLEMISAVAKLGGASTGLELMERLTPAEKTTGKAIALRLELLAEMGRWKEVVETAEVSAEVRSRFDADEQISIWGWLGLARHAQADVSAFQASIRALEALVGTNAARAMRVGHWLASRGFDFEAAGFFRTASSPNSPRRYQALEALNGLYARTGDRQKRLQACEQLLQLDSENPAVQSELASVLLELGWDRERALKLARDAWERNRASYAFMDTYARALAMNGLAIDGVAMYEQMPPEVLAKDEIRLNYMESLMAAGRFADARLQLNRIRAENLPRAVQARRDRLEIELRAR